jgi:hypothetical protein
MHPDAPAPPLRDFDTDFAPLFTPALQAVDVVHDLSPEDFERYYRRPGRPVIIEGVSTRWPALHRWTELAHLQAAAGHRPVFVRDLAAGCIDAGPYREVYRELSFGDFAQQVFSDPPPPLYLTQALIDRGNGLAALLGRKLSPAWLPELAADFTLPPYWAREHLFEANLWMGPGGQVSGLHFDEFDNLNAPIHGHKRWILFPHDQTQRLLDGDWGMNTIGPGFHADAPRRFSGERSRVRGYQCVTQPGQLLFVPAGMWHQVFSGPGLSLALNFWYLQWPRDLGSALLHARRHTGFPARKRFPLVLAMVLAQFAWKASQYALGRRPIRDVQVGVTGYGL